MQIQSRAFVVIAALAAAGASAPVRAQTVLPQKTKQWPLTAQDAREAKAGEAPGQPAADAPGMINGWPIAEIEMAKARCNVILAKTGAVATPMAPIHEGDCGTPYPVSVTSVGPVHFTQPAVVNCEVIATFAEWMQQDVQPLAHKMLGGRVEKAEILSSYSCRNAYGRKRSRLSEHGRAHAIDVKAFITAKGHADVLADWGMTERDVKAKIAAAEAAARALAKAKADAEAKALADARARGATPPVASNTITGSTPAHGISPVPAPAPAVDGFAALRGMVPDVILGLSPGHDGARGLSLEQPSRLGGPKAKETVGTAHVLATKPLPEVVQPTVNARQAFLKQIHVSACRRFGTVLGPEANEAHRNHFHLDIAERGQRGSFCE